MASDRRSGPQARGRVETWEPPPACPELIDEDGRTAVALARCDDTQEPLTLEGMSARERKRVKRNTPGGARNRPARRAIDWDAAYDFFAGLAPGERTYAAVARRYGVTDARVGVIARREGWQQRVAVEDAKRRRNLEARRIRVLAERDEDTIRTIEAMRIKMAQQLADPTFRISVGDFVQALRIERLIEGESTDSASRVAEIEAKLERLPLPVVERIAVALIRGEPVDETIDGMAREIEG
jgi:hypothetical protein